jgi:hypothetical protein
MRPAQSELAISTSFVDMKDGRLLLLRQLARTPTDDNVAPAHGREYKARQAQSNCCRRRKAVANAKTSFGAEIMTR